MMAAKLMRGLDSRLVYAILMCFVSCLLMAGGAVYYSVHTAHAEGRNFCEILATSLEVYSTNPPQTDTGKTLARETAQLYKKLEC